MVFFVKVRGPELKDTHVGQSEKSIRELINKASDAFESDGLFAPFYIIFLDEVDALVPRRSTSESATHNNSLTNQFLACISGDVPPNLLIFATTNFKEMIDPAFLREGRIGKQYDFELPNNKQRREIINLYLKNSEINFDRLVELSKGFTGADIEAEINRCKLKVLSNDQLVLTQALVENIFEQKQRMQVRDFYVWHDDIAKFIERILLQFDSDKTNICFFNVYGKFTFFY